MDDLLAEIEEELPSPVEDNDPEEAGMTQVQKKVITIHLYWRMKVPRTNFADTQHRQTFCRGRNRSQGQIGGRAKARAQGFARKADGRNERSRPGSVRRSSQRLGQQNQKDKS